MWRCMQIRFVKKKTKNFKIWYSKMRGCRTSFVRILLFLINDQFPAWRKWVEAFSEICLGVHRFRWQACAIYQITTCLMSYCLAAYLLMNKTCVSLLFCPFSLFFFSKSSKFLPFSIYLHSSWLRFTIVKFLPSTLWRRHHWGIYI